MKWFFMVIEGDQDEPLYSNLYESSPETLTLKHFQTVLERFSIRNISLEPGHNSGLYEKLMKDKTQKNMS
ncbi:hypothetical protein HP459_20370 [Enterobacter sp. CM29]|nr:hypothetical protein [Enterobacter sp. CM29]